MKTCPGDLFAIPLAIGTAIGRVGCFLTGLAAWHVRKPNHVVGGHRFGDGIRRHPTQLYEIAFLVLLAAALTKTARRSSRTGEAFRMFMVGYVGFRLLVDSLKPAPAPGLGLSTIQWACVAAPAYYVPDTRRSVRKGVGATHLTGRQT